MMSYCRRVNLARQTLFLGGGGVVDEKLISSISCFIHVNFMQFYEIKLEDE